MSGTGLIRGPGPNDPALDLTFLTYLSLRILPLATPRAEDAKYELNDDYYYYCTPACEIGGAMLKALASCE